MMQLQKFFITILLVIAVFTSLQSQPVKKAGNKKNTLAVTRIKPSRQPTIQIFCLTTATFPRQESRFILAIRIWKTTLWMSHFRPTKNGLLLKAVTKW